MTYFAAVGAANLLAKDDVSTNSYFHVAQAGVSAQISYPELFNKISDDLGTTSVTQSSVLSALKIFNVREYGATGTNATADTTAVQNAFNALRSAGGGLLIFPRDPAGINNVISTNTITLDDLICPQGATVYVAEGVTWKHATSATDVMLKVGLSPTTSLPSIVNASVENVTIQAAGLIQGKGRVNAQFLGSDGGTKYDATFVSTGVVTVSGDLTAVFTVNATVNALNGTSSIANNNQIQVVSATYSSGTGLTTITTNGTFGATCNKIQLVIDFSDGFFSPRRCRNVKIYGNYKDFGNHIARPALTGESYFSGFLMQLLWVEYGDVPTYVDATTVTVPGDKTNADAYPVGAWVEFRSSSAVKATAKVTAAVYSAPNTTLTLEIKTGAIDNTIVGMRRSVLDRGTFKGDVEVLINAENCGQCITTNDSGHEGVRILPGTTFYKCGAGFKYTSKGITRNNSCRGAIFRNCGISAWIQTGSGIDVSGNTFIECGKSGFNECFILAYNNLERIVDYTSYDVKFNDNNLIDCGSLYIQLDPNIISQNIEICGNKITSTSVARSNAVIYMTGKIEGLKVNRNTIINPGSGIAGISINPTTGAGDTHREQIEVNDNCISGVAAATPIKINGSTTRSAKDVKMCRNSIPTESATSNDIRYIEDGIFTENNSLTAFSNHITYKSRWIGNTIKTTTASGNTPLHMNTSTDVQVIGNYLETNVSSANCIAFGAASNILVSGNKTIGNNRGIGTSSNPANVTIINNDIVLTGSGGLAIAMTGTASRPMIINNRIDANGGTAISINGSPTKWVCNDNFYLGTLSITTGAEKSYAGNIDMS